MIQHYYSNALICHPGRIACAKEYWQFSQVMAVAGIVGVEPCSHLSGQDRHGHVNTTLGQFRNDGSTANASLQYHQIQ